MEILKRSSLIFSISLLFVGLIVGSGGVYFTLSNKHQGARNDYENQIEELSMEISSLNSTVYTLELEKLNYELQISLLEAARTRLYFQVQNQSISLNTLQSNVSELLSRLDAISSIVVTQHYEWEFKTGFWTSEWFWDLSIPLSTYLEYYFRERPSDWEDWIDMVRDPDDDHYIDIMVQRINSAAISGGLTESEKVNFVITFVQSLPYTEDSVTTAWDEYPRYPIETLFDRGGDCEDTSILVATLLDRMGYDVCLLILEEENHCAVGVAIPDVYGYYYDYEGVQYFYLETTGEGWKIGDVPSEYIDSTAYIYPVN